VDVEGVDGKLAGIAAIKAHDPAFDEDVFAAQVQRLFFAVLEAWTSLQPELSQGVMGANIWQEQKAEIGTYQGHHWQNRLDGLTLVSAMVVGARCDTNFDTLTVRINANSADYDVDAGGTLIRGTKLPFEWTEDWIFQRPASLKTGPPGTVTSEVCPSCGARVNVDITSICPYCDAAVISGRFGWSLTRIDRV
jgi:predicted lipid-binding transport protein (Tim44 family)